MNDTTTPDNRAAAKARVRAKVEARKAMPAREYLLDMLHATHTHAAAEQLLDRLVNESATAARLSAVLDLCDREERGAMRWENPLPVPEWVAVVQRAALGDDVPAETHEGYDIAGEPATHQGPREKCWDPACENGSPGLAQQREQLLEAMSGVSEERYCAGWIQGLDRTLHAEGGVWEHVGRAIGWPVGDYEQWTWLPWDEAAAHYAVEDGADRG